MLRTIGAAGHMLPLTHAPAIAAEIAAHVACRDQAGATAA
jgi:hypothetical protein